MSIKLIVSIVAAVLVVGAVILFASGNSMVGGVLGSLGVLLFGRNMKDLNKAKQEAHEARTQGKQRVDEAADKAAAHVHAEDERAEKEKQNVVDSHDLGSYLLERDPGPSDDNG